jgi:hypothetical protein
MDSQWPVDSIGWWQDYARQRGRAHAAMSFRRRYLADWSAAMRYLRASREAGLRTPGPSDLGLAADRALAVMVRRRHLTGTQRPSALTVREALRAVVALACEEEVSP